MHKVDDVIILRHNMLRRHRWRIIKTIPSLQEGVMLHRIQLIDAPSQLHREITVQDNAIKENLGGYEEWLVSNKKSDS